MWSVVCSCSVTERYSACASTTFCSFIHRFKTVDWFFLSAVVIDAAMNIHTHIFPWMFLFTSLGDIPSSRIASHEEFHVWPFGDLPAFPTAAAALPVPPAV